jgi:hypothetical protein
MASSIRAWWQDNARADVVGTAVMRASRQVDAGRRALREEVQARYPGIDDA